MQSTTYGTSEGRSELELATRAIYQGTLERAVKLSEMTDTVLEFLGGLLLPELDRFSRGTDVRHLNPNLRRDIGLD